MSVSELPPAAASAQGHVELSSSLRSIQLSLVASDFRPVASGVGRLTATVAPGIYQVVARAGPVTERRLISVGPGETYRDDEIKVRFPTPAPINKTTTSHEYHQEAAVEATGRLSQMTGPPAGLAIVVRDVRGTDGPPFDPNDVACFSLIDANLTRLPGFEQGWYVRDGLAVAFWAGRLPAGGYALRTDPSVVTSGDRVATSRHPFDQSLWLSDHWQTVVFITTGPGGPQTSAGSIHMAQMSVGWSPYDTETGLALELATWGLREGRSVLPDDLEQLLIGSKFVNPMLGIIGAHSLLLRAEVDWRLLDIVLGNLQSMVPGHPDVTALRWMAARRQGMVGNGAGTPGAMPPPATGGLPQGGATWPPMLLASYRALIEMDATDRDAIADGSPAELAASNLLVQGLWTSWTPVVFAPPPPPSPPMPSPPPGGQSPDDARVPPTSGGGPVWPPMTAAQVLTAFAGDPSLVDRAPRDDPASARIGSYLSALAVLEGSRRSHRFVALTPEDVALATTLPLSTVYRSLSRMGAALGPPPPPNSPPPAGGGGGASGGGSGISKGVMATLLAVGALVLIGGAGVTAWCSADASCPLRVAAPATATRPPTMATATANPAMPRASRTPRITPTSTPPIPGPTAILVSVPPSVPFGAVTVGGAPAQQWIVVTSSEPVNVKVELLDDGGAFAAGEPCQPVPEVGASWACETPVSFTPTALGPYAGTASVQVADEPEARTVGLEGEGTPLSLSFESPLEFDTVFVDFPSTQTAIIGADEPARFDVVEVEDAVGFFQPVTTSCDLTLNDVGVYECPVQVTMAVTDSGEFFGAVGFFTAGIEVARLQLHGFGDFSEP